MIPPEVISLLSIITSGLVSYLLYRQRRSNAKLQAQMIEVQSDADNTKATNDRQDKLLDLFRRQIEQGEKTNTLLQKSMENSSADNEHWRVSVDGNTAQLKEVATLVRDFREFSTGQHRDTRLAVQNASSSLELKVEAVRTEVVGLRADLKQRMDELPTILDLKFKSIENRLSEITTEIAKPKESMTND